jgi:hypothetical protein
MPDFRVLRQLGVLTDQLTLHIPEVCKSSHYIYGPKPAFEHPMNQFFDTILRWLLSTISWVDLTPNEHWSPGFIQRHVAANSLVVIKARLSFKSKRTLREGPNQMRKVYHRRNGIQLTFHIDGWMALSPSAYTLHLTGTNELTAVCLVRAVEDVEGLLELRATCLAIGTGFGPSLVSRKPRIALVKEEEERRLSDLAEELYWEERASAWDEEEGTDAGTVQLSETGSEELVEDEV